MHNIRYINIVKKYYVDMFFYVSDIVHLIGITCKYIDMKCTKWATLKSHGFIYVYLCVVFTPFFIL